MGEAAFRFAQTAGADVDSQIDRDHVQRETAHEARRMGR